MMTLQSRTTAPRGRAAALMVASLVVLGACIDKDAPSVTAASPRVRFQVATNFNRQDAPAARTVDVKVGYARGGAFVPLTQESVAATPGTTQDVSITVDLTTCMNDPARDNASGGACPLRVSVALRDSVAFALDSVMLSSDAAPGRTPVLPAIDLATTRFSVRQWVGDEALRLGGPNTPWSFTAPLVGYASGSSAPALYTGMVDSSGDPGLAIFQNGAWQVIQSHLGRGVVFNTMSVLAPNDIWITTASGIMHYDGTTFSRALATTDTLIAISAFATATGRIVMASGTSGTLWTGDGTSWKKSNLGTTDAIIDVCVTSSNEAFATSAQANGVTVPTGATGSVFHLSGGTWSGSATAFPNYKIELQCPGAGVAYALANQQGALRWNGSAWVVAGVPGVPGRLFNWAVVSPTEMYAYADSSVTNRAFYVGTGTSWKEVGRTSFVQNSSFLEFLKMWADPRGGAAYHMVSAFGRLEQITPTSYKTLSYMPALRDGIVVSPSTAFVVGWNLFLARWNGVSWTVDAPPAGTAGVRILQGVWSDGPSNAWAVGNGSTIFHWNGTAWAVVSDIARPIVGVDNYNAAWGQGTTVFLAGDSTVTRCVSTTQCSREAGVPGTGSLYGIWGTAATNVTAVGQGGRIVHYDGTTWSSVASPTTRTLVRVWGSSATDAWALGDSVLIHFDGTRWSNVPMTGDLAAVQSPAPSSLQGVFQLGLWGSGPKDVYVGGEAGRIVRFDGTTWRSMGSVSAHRVLSISGAAGYGALAVLDGQTTKPGSSLLRGVGPAGGFGAPMVPPAIWP